MPTQEGTVTPPVTEETKTTVTPEANTEVKSDANSNAPSSDGADTEAKPETRATLLDAVRSAVKKPDTSTPEPSGRENEAKVDDKSDKSKDGAAATADAAGADKYDDPKLPFHKHPRWVELRSELKEAKAAIAATEPALKRDASIGQFMSRNQLEPNDMVETFRLAALVRNDPANALKELRQLVADLEGDLGERLPPDLQAALDDGELTEKRAYELAKARATAKVATETATRTQAAVTEQDNQTRQQTHLRALGEMALKWEGEQRGKDPDFDLKYPEVQEIVRARSAVKPPKSVAEAAQYLEDALTRVNKIVTLAKPKPKPINPGGQRTSSASVTENTSAPKTMRDAIRGAIG